MQGYLGIYCSVSKSDRWYYKHAIFLWDAQIIFFRQCQGLFMTCTVSQAHAPEIKQNKTLFDMYKFFFLNVLVPGFLSVVYAVDGGAEL